MMVVVVVVSESRGRSSKRVQITKLGSKVEDVMS
jgi:hypothetical protein